MSSPIAKCAVILGAILVVVLLWSLGPVIVWVGHFSVVVRVHSERAADMERLEYASLFRSEHATALAQGAISADNIGFYTADDFDGSEFVASVPCSGRERLGYELNRVEARFIIVRATYSDGASRLAVAAIPRAGRPREMDIVVPAASVKTDVASADGSS